MPSRGSALGNRELARVWSKAVQLASELAREVTAALRFGVMELHTNERNLRAIASELNGKGLVTALGLEWHASSVREILAEAGDPTA